MSPCLPVACPISHLTPTLGTHSLSVSLPPSLHSCRPCYISISLFLQLSAFRLSKLLGIAWFRKLSLTFPVQDDDLCFSLKSLVLKSLFLLLQTSVIWPILTDTHNFLPTLNIAIFCQSQPNQPTANGIDFLQKCTT